MKHVRCRPKDFLHNCIQSEFPKKTKLHFIMHLIFIHIYIFFNYSKCPDLFILFSFAVNLIICRFLILLFSFNSIRYFSFHIVFCSCCLALFFLQLIKPKAMLHVQVNIFSEYPFQCLVVCLKVNFCSFWSFKSTADLPLSLNEDRKQRLGNCASPFVFKRRRKVMQPMLGSK